MAEVQEKSEISVAWRKWVSWRDEFEAARRDCRRLSPVRDSSGKIRLDTRDHRALTQAMNRYFRLAEEGKRLMADYLGMTPPA